MNLYDRYLTNGIVTPANIKYYKEKGYLIAPSLFTEDEIGQLKDETTQIFRGKRGAPDGLLPVSDKDSDAEVLKKYVAIHFPHKISPVIKDYLSHPGIINILRQIVSPNIKCMQSMLFVKGPGKPGQSWHQDEYYIPTRDCSLTGAWIAVDDATVENGCLWIVPGSNKPSWIRPRVKNISNEYADPDSIDISGFAKGDIVPAAVKSGSVVFFNGYTLHSSLRNKTEDCFRTALVNHYMSAESMLPWDQDGKLPATEDLRDVLLIAGSDPYEYKGTVDVNKPYLRPETYSASIK